MSKPTYEELEQKIVELSAKKEWLREKIWYMSMQVQFHDWGKPFPAYDFVEEATKILLTPDSSVLAALKAQWQADAVDRCEKELTASVNVLLKPHIAGVFAVIRQRTQEVSDDRHIV